MDDRTFIAALRRLPKNALSRAVGRLTDASLPGPLLRPAIRAFARRYAIDLAEYPPLESYATFGKFFARPLLEGRRPVAAGEAVVVSPVDARVSEAGLAVGGRMIQAKGIDYTVAGLLADEPAAGAAGAASGEGALARRFEGGAWTTLYLSPQDYHRIHFPLGGRVIGWRYVPGELWPVNGASVGQVPGLFTVNERLVTLLDSPLGLVAIVAVGATVVGRVRAAYDAAVPTTDQAGARGVQAGRYEQPIPVGKGDLLGAFEMGSTVILVFEPDRVRLDGRLVPGARVKVGEAIGGVA
jgi:phosphatidylserine decarboxylase